MQPAREAFKECPRCRRVYLDRWDFIERTKFVGIQKCIIGDRKLPDLMLRQCKCKTTLAIEEPER